MNRITTLRSFNPVIGKNKNNYSTISVLITTAIVLILFSIIFNLLTAPKCAKNELAIQDDLGKFVCVPAEDAAIIIQRRHF